MSFQPQTYGPAFAELLATDRCRPLDEGTLDGAMWARLSGLTVSTAFDHTSVADREMASACLAGVWLLYDHLNDSHRLSQDIDSASGSFWHGIMHRREGDFGNAKYWFRNVGTHPVYDELAAVAGELATLHQAHGVLPPGQWDAAAFVDACQQALGGRSEQQTFCQAVQQAEWELLFDYCYQVAVG